MILFSCIGSCHLIQQLIDHKLDVALGEVVASSGATVVVVVNWWNNRRRRWWIVIVMVGVIVVLPGCGAILSGRGGGADGELANTAAVTYELLVLGMGLQLFTLALVVAG